MSDEDRVKLITARRVAEAVTLVVNELPQGEGAPTHALYAGIIAFLSIDEFETMMRGLVFAGRVRREGDLYYPRKPTPAAGRLCGRRSSLSPPPRRSKIRPRIKLMPALCEH